MLNSINFTARSFASESDALAPISNLFAHSRAIGVYSDTGTKSQCSLTSNNSFVVVSLSHELEVVLLHRRLLSVHVLQCYTSWHFCYTISALSHASWLIFSPVVSYDKLVPQQPSGVSVEPVCYDL